MHMVEGVQGKAWGFKRVKRTLLLGINTACLQDPVFISVIGGLSHCHGL